MLFGVSFIESSIFGEKNNDSWAISFYNSVW